MGFCHFETLSVFKGFCRFSCFKTLLEKVGRLESCITKVVRYEGWKVGMLGGWKVGRFKSFFHIPCFQTLTPSRAPQAHSVFKEFGRFSCFPVYRHFPYSRYLNVSRNSKTTKSLEKMTFQGIWSFLLFLDTFRIQGILSFLLF